MMKETEEIIHAPIDFLPLKSYTNITLGNALRVDWENVVPKDELNFIMGIIWTTNIVGTLSSQEHSSSLAA